MQKKTLTVTNGLIPANEFFFEAFIVDGQIGVRTSLTDQAFIVPANGSIRLTLKAGTVPIGTPFMLDATWAEAPL
jgi:hypothetical protein